MVLGVLTMAHVQFGVRVSLKSISPEGAAAPKP